MKQILMKYPNKAMAKQAFKIDFEWHKKTNGGEVIAFDSSRMIDVGDTRIWYWNDSDNVELAFIKGAVFDQVIVCEELPEDYNKLMNSKLWEIL